jgi:ElaA protein
MYWACKGFDELTNKELYEILKSRAEIFIKEQEINYVDPDDVDYESLHVFRMNMDRIDAYLRVYRTDKDTVKIGRVLTLTHGQGTGSELMDYALKVIPEKMECNRIVMDAQKYAVPFYEKHGFTVTSDEYLEEGIVHVDMCRQL